MRVGLLLACPLTACWAVNPSCRRLLLHPEWQPTQGCLQRWNVAHEVMGGGAALRRFTFEELQGFVEAAKACIPGTADAVEAAAHHRAHQVPPPRTTP